MGFLNIKQFIFSLLFQYFQTADVASDALKIFDIERYYIYITGG